MSQVKNLRAMFEQKAPETTAPERTMDRGRSPGVPLPSTESPRPLSKVRTSFIAVVEKDGRMGLRRDESGESSVSRRRMSQDTEGETPMTSQDSTSTMTVEPATSTPGPSSKPFKTNLFGQTIPESPRQDGTATNGQVAKSWGALSDKPSVNPDKHVDVEVPTAKLLPADPKTKVGSDASAAVPNGVADSSSNKDKAKARESAPASKESSSSKAASSGTVTKKPSKLGISAAAAGTAAKGSTKSPTVKTPTSPQKADKLPAKTPESKLTSTAGPSRTPKQAPTATTSSKAATPAAAPSTSTVTATPTSSSTTAPPAPAPASTPSSSRKTSGKPTPAPVTLSPAHDRGIGFVKPKPKSPTRPVQLPASLMRQTTSSGSKVKDPPRESLSRASGSVLTLQSLQQQQLLQPAGRSPSRASVATTAAGSSHTLKRQKSSINRPRPSLGPPPRRVAQDHPVAKKEKDVDESFLARMMRPTQSSSFKTQDKTPVTPPRRVVAQPPRKLGDGGGSAKKVMSAKKIVPAAALTSGGESSAVVPEVAMETAQVETAEEAVELAEKMEVKPAVAGEETAAPEAEDAAEASKSSGQEFVDAAKSMPDSNADSLPADGKEDLIAASEAPQANGTTDETGAEAEPKAATEGHASG